MIITKELMLHFKPAGRTVSSYAIPTKSNDGFEWGNPDDEFTATYTCSTKEFKAEYYKWDEETQDWIDDVEMDDTELLNRLKCGEFVIA